MVADGFSHTAYICRETMVSMIINAVLSFAFFAAVFGFGQPTQIWGLGQWIFDFLPQSFMVAFMGSLVPSLIARRNLARGAVTTGSTPSRLPKSPLFRALLFAIAAVAAGPLAVAVLALAVGGEQIDPYTACAIKMAYGALVAAIVTPLSLRATLSA